MDKIVFKDVKYFFFLAIPDADALIMCPNQIYP